MSDGTCIDFDAHSQRRTSGQRRVPSCAFCQQKWYVGNESYASKVAYNQEGETSMKIKLGIMFTISSVLMFFLGLGLTVMTSTMLGMINLDANPAAVHFAKAAGGALLGLAVMTWLARNSGPSPARNALVLGLTLIFLLEGIEYVRAILTGSLQAVGWLSAGMWLILFVFMAFAGWSAMSEAS
jgi:hypothetical protein